MKVQLIFVAAVLLTAPLVWRLPKVWRGRTMIFTSLLVLGVMAPWSVLMMVSVAFLQWLIWKQENVALRQLRLILSAGLPLLPLLVYKLGHKVDHWAIPLGLSYYAFRQIHVAFECYKGTMARPTLEEYFQYLLFLPVLLIGPIHRMPEMQRSFRRHKWQPSDFSEGLERILYGMVKVNVLGNYLFTYKLVEWASQLEGSRLQEYIKMMAFTGNAYMQFAGFSDMAVGMGLLWGIRVMENFNHPFVATNMQDFWQRWHISLSTWCRDYVFQPILAFSRNGWVALAASMLVLALWHEISLRYIFWGLFHTLLILATIITRKRMPALSRFINLHPAGRWLGRVWVLHLFAISCLFIQTESFQELGIKINSLFG